MKKICKVCGDEYIADPDEDIRTEICEECFLDREYGQSNNDYEQFSDADPGL